MDLIQVVTMIFFFVGGFLKGKSTSLSRDIENYEMGYEDAVDDLKKQEGLK